MSGYAAEERGKARRALADADTLRDAGDADRRQGRLLNELADLREQADYGYEPLDVDVDGLREEAAEFVTLAESLVDDA